MISNTNHPTLLRAWPAFAAGVAAFAGMSSCVAGLLPLSMFGAPVLGVVVTGVVFTLMLRLVPPPGSSEEQRTRLRAASITAFLVCVATGWWFARKVVSGQSGEATIYNPTVVTVGLVGGAVVGLGAAVLVRTLGLSHYRRR